MPLLLLLGGGDSSGTVDTPPEPGVGDVTQFPAAFGTWRMALEVAMPPATTWYDITQFYVGDRYQRGADEYKGKYRASLATVQLQIDNVQADDLGVSADILAPWGQDTTPLFGANVRLGAGLLIRLSMTLVVDDVVTEWLPIWTGRVEQWGDASQSIGQVRTHVVNVVDLLSDLANNPVELTGFEAEWPDWFTVDLLPAAGWQFGVDVYGDPGLSGMLGDDLSTAAIVRMDQAADPLGLVWRTLRSGRMVIHPAPWDTQHVDRYANPLLDVYPDGLRFTYAPDFTDVEYIADDEQQPFGIPRSIAGILNSFAVTWPDGFTTFTYLNDDPVSIGRYGVRPFTATWVIPGVQEAGVDDLLADRAFAESQALPLRTTIDHEGFWPALAMIDHLDPVTVIHATSPDGLVVTGTGWVRNIVEERTVRDAGLLNWQSTVQIDIDSTETSEPLLPVEDLALVSTESPLLTTTSTAVFSWTNPTQPSITPTEVQYRLLGRSNIWLPKSYPGVGADGLVTYGLEAGTRYTFQVRLVRRVDGVVTNYSVWRSVTFTTPFRIYPRPVPDGDQTGGEFPEGPDDCGAFSVELQENDGTGWATVDTFSGAELTDNGDGTFSLTTPIDNSFFNAGSMYRFVTLCDGDIVTVGPEFDPPDDWTDPCPTPAALSDPPFDDPSMILYVPKVCTGAEDGDPDYIFQGMQIIEAVSGIAGVPGDALDEIQTGITAPTSYALLALPDPAWSDTPGGILAYGECPQIIGKTGDKTITVRTNITDAVACVLGEVAGMQITCVPTSGGWRAAVVVFRPSGTTTLPTVTELDEGTTYVISAKFRLSTGEVTIEVDGVVDNTVGGTDNEPTINPLPIWRVGAPPSSWVTDFALFDDLFAPTAGNPTIVGLGPTRYYTTHGTLPFDDLGSLNLDTTSSAGSFTENGETGGDGDGYLDMTGTTDIRAGYASIGAFKANDPQTLVILLKPDAVTGASRYILQQGDGSNVRGQVFIDTSGILYYVGANDTQLVYYGSVAAGAVAGAWNLYTFRQQGGLYEWRRNNVDITGASVIDVQAASAMNAFRIGGSNYSGGIAHVATFDILLSPTDLTDIYNSFVADGWSI